MSEYQPSRKASRVGQTKTVGGKSYRLNENHRWELIDTNTSKNLDVTPRATGGHTPMSAKPSAEASKPATAPTPDAPKAEAKPEYHRGDLIKLTGRKGNDIHGGKPAKTNLEGFEEFEYLEGAKKGQTGVRMSQETRAAEDEKRKKAYQDQQADFAKLHKNPNANERELHGHALGKAEAKPGINYASNNLPPSLADESKNRRREIVKARYLKNGRQGLGKTLDEFEGEDWLK